MEPVKGDHSHSYHKWEQEDSIITLRLQGSLISELADMIILTNSNILYYWPLTVLTMRS